MLNSLLDEKEFEESKLIITDLVNRFKSNEAQYLAKNYKEEDIKTEFITPMFEALGWDVNNKSGNAPEYKDVIFEETINVGKENKNPDYTFRIGGQKLFFLEAKAAHKDIKHDHNPAFQVRRYGWSAKLDLCILTDFEEFAVYETNTKPNNTQAPSVGRILYYRYDEYLEHWDEIYNIFSKEAVKKGLYNKFINDTEGVKKGTTEVDKEFLKEIEHWREILAKNIVKNNKDINIDSLNYAVQLTIDRILFFRMAEDRGIETYKTLYDLMNNENIYEQLMELFKVADKKYNSGLFCLTADPNKHLNRDTITETLTLDDSVFKEIFKGLYYPESPYEFSVISPEILGQVYEQFLGSRIRLTPKKLVKIEEKPEVKKSGGVFYTPQKIVKEIVEKTITPKIKGKTPNQISKLKIIDIACGSGSFLLGAYKKLLDYHLDYYTNLERSNDIYQGRDGKWRLTIKKKKEILKNNIYGVDIDFLAVEVSKLTLLLQVLEDQNKDVVEQQQKLYHEHVLPDLSDNVKNGNSIVETDYQTDDLSELDIIKPFNYWDEFPEVYENGGFDVIVTNPPYVRSGLIHNNEKKYLKDHYKVSTGNADYYVYFYEKAFNLLNDKGYFGLICSNKFTRAAYGKKLRKYLLKYNFLYYHDYTKETVFKTASVDPIVLAFQKTHTKNNKILIPEIKYDKNNNIIDKNKYYLPQGDLTEDVWIFETEKENRLKKKILNKGVRLGELNVVFNSGIKTGCNKAFVINEKIKEKLIAEDVTNSEIIHPLLGGKDIKKWIMLDNKYLIFTPIGVEMKKYSSIKKYLDNYKDELKSRTDKGNYYWEIRPCAYYDNIFSDKIVWADISKQPAFSVDLDNHLVLNSAYLLNSYDENYPLYYLVGLLNSNVTNWIFRRISAILTTSMRFTKQYVSQIPIVDADKKIKDRIMELSKNIISYYDLFNSSDSTPSQKKVLKRQISTSEKELNEIVYSLYGLNEEEIKLIEETLIK